MKKFFSILIAGMTLGAGLTSCDEVGSAERFVEADIVAHRAILIEEFTGQNCTNCPDGHVAIKDIISALGDSIVAVSIHASNLALNPPVGYKTAAGEEIYNAAGQPPLPAAIINRQTAALQVANWGQPINQIIMRPTDFTVKAHATVNGDKYDIDVAFSGAQDFEGDLSVWVVESDLVGRQLDHGVLVRDYVHNHVFREAVNGTWGESVSLKAHEPQYKSYSVDIPSSWDTDHIYVVAFLSDGSGVVQVTSTATH